MQNTDPCPAYEDVAGSMSAANDIEPDDAASESASVQRLLSSPRSSKSEHSRVVTTADHALPVASIEDRYAVSVITGLLWDLVDGRLQKYGANRIVVLASWMPGWWCFATWLVLAAVAAATIPFATDDLVEFDLGDEWMAGCILACLVVFMLVVSFFYLGLRLAPSTHHWDSEVGGEVSVRRDSTRTTVDARDVAVGDVVRLTGRASHPAKAPADLRVVRVISRHSWADQTFLSGIPDCTDKSEASESAETPELLARNLVFAGAKVIGSLEAIVRRTGMSTAGGRILEDSVNIKAVATTALRDALRLSQLVLRVVAAITGIALLMLMPAFVSNVTHLLPLIMHVISSAVLAASPFAMLGVLVLMLCAIRLSIQPSKERLTSRVRLDQLHEPLDSDAQQLVQVLRPLGDISLARATVVVTDALTYGQLRFSRLWLDMQCCQCDQELRQHKFDPSSPTATAALNVMALCNTANLMGASDVLVAGIDRLVINGDPISASVLRFVASVHDVRRLATESLVRVAPFRVGALTIAVAVLPGSGDEYHPVLMMMGDARAVWRHCSSVMVDGYTRPIQQPDLAWFSSCLDEMSHLGEISVACAIHVLSPTDYPAGFRYTFNKDADVFGTDTDALTNLPVSSMVLVCVGGMMDAPLSGVADALSTLRASGVSVIAALPTATVPARTIAQRCGVFPGNTRSWVSHDQGIQPPSEVPDYLVDSELVDCADTRASTWSAIDWDRVLAADRLAFAGALPADKAEIVEQLQQRGHLVAVVGAEVKDALALAKADAAVLIGVKRGDATLWPVTASDLVLPFSPRCWSTVLDALRIGRLRHRAWRDANSFILACKLPLVLALVLCLASGLPPALLSPHILYLDLLVTLPLALAIVWSWDAEDGFEIAPRAPPLHGNQQYLRSLFASPSSVVAVAMVQFLTIIAAYYLTWLTYGVVIHELAYSYLPFDGVPESLADVFPMIDPDQYVNYTARNRFLRIITTVFLATAVSQVATFAVLRRDSNARKYDVLTAAAVIVTAAILALALGLTRGFAMATPVTLSQYGIMLVALPLAAVYDLLRRCCSCS